MIFFLFLGFVLGAVAVIFILQNTEVVALTFLQWQFDTSLALVVICSILVGALIALFITLPGAIGDSFTVRRLNKHNKLLTKEAAEQKQFADEAAARLAVAEAQETVIITDA